MTALPSFLSLPALDLATTDLYLVERGWGSAPVDAIHAPAWRPPTDHIWRSLVNISPVNRLLLVIVIDIVQTLLPVSLMTGQIYWMFLNARAWKRPVHDGVDLAETCGASADPLRSDRPLQISSFITSMPGWGSLKHHVILCLMRFNTRWRHQNIILVLLLASTDVEWGGACSAPHKDLPWVIVIAECGEGLLLLTSLLLVCLLPSRACSTATSRIILLRNHIIVIKFTAGSGTEVRVSSLRSLPSTSAHFWTLAIYAWPGPLEILQVLISQLALILQIVPWAGLALMHVEEARCHGLRAWDVRGPIRTLLYFITIFVFVIFIEFSGCRDFIIFILITVTVTVFRIILEIIII